MSEEPSIVEGEAEVSVNAGDDTSRLDSSPTTVPNTLTEVSERLSAFAAEIRALNDLAHAREESITRLHDEVQQLRRGELTQAVAPLIRDLIHLHDQLAAAVAARESAGNNADVKDLVYFRDEVIEILARYDVELFVFDTGDAFDPSAQRAVSAVPIDDASLDRRIAVTRRPGFRSGSRIVRFADVDVYRLAIQPSRTDSSS